MSSCLLRGCSQAGMLLVKALELMPELAGFQAFSFQSCLCLLQACCMPVCSGAKPFLCSSGHSAQPSSTTEPSLSTRALHWPQASASVAMQQGLSESELSGAGWA